MIQFKGFKPEAEERIARTMGYSGDMEGFATYLAQNPEKQDIMNKYRNSAMNMLKGGVVRKKYNKGGGVSQLPYYDEYLQSDAYKETLPTAENPFGPAYAAVMQDVNVDGQTYSLTASQAEPYQKFLNSRNQQPAAQQPVVQQQLGGAVTDTTTTSLQDQMANQAYNPELPYGGAVYAQGVGLQDQQFVPTTSGQVSGDVSATASQAATAQAQAPTATAPAKLDATQVTGAMEQQLAGVDPAQQAGLSPEATATAATQTDTMVSEVTAAQGTGILMQNPTQRKIQEGELISGVADAQTAAKFTEQVQAAEATPSKQATVQGQLEGLMQQFEGGETPAWAAGAMRAATATMTARGLGASSMAGQAIVQAAMESALPIAQADAGTRAAFEAQNLSNRQERAMLAAQQRASFIGMEFDQAFQARVMNASKISDVANMNFTAEQQVALENSRVANTMNLANLSNSQAMVMAEAAALANMDMANLSNRQQAAVMNAQNFLQMDMANLSNQQQTEMFKAQSRVQALFTDQAATNAAAQFNATSQNQVDQFFANLSSQVATFNASQANAQAQFNAEITNQRDQFNAQNQLVIAQSNAQWRRSIATADTATTNRVNELNAMNMLGISNQAYNNLWQLYGDTMDWAFESSENELNRDASMALAILTADQNKSIAELKTDAAAMGGWAALGASILGSDFGSDMLSSAWDGFTELLKL